MLVARNCLRKTKGTDRVNKSNSPFRGQSETRQDNGPFLTDKILNNPVEAVSLGVPVSQHVRGAIADNMGAVGLRWCIRVSEVIALAITGCQVAPMVGEVGKTSAATLK